MNVADKIKSADRARYDAFITPEERALATFYKHLFRLGWKAVANGNVMVPMTGKKAPRAPIPVPAAVADNIVGCGARMRVLFGLQSYHVYCTGRPESEPWWMHSPGMARPPLNQRARAIAERFFDDMNALRSGTLSLGDAAPADRRWQWGNE